MNTSIMKTKFIPILWVRRLVSGILCLAAIAIFFSTILGIYFVPSGSMSPAILPGDQIVVNRLAYGLRLPFYEKYLTTWEKPRNGDVIVFLSPWDSSQTFVKRVAAVEGDALEWDGLPRFFQADSMTWTLDRGRVPKGYVFCIGDNIEESFDSRSWGLISVEQIYGKVVGILFSVVETKDTRSLFRSDRWFRHISSETSDKTLK